MKIKKRIMPLLVALALVFTVIPLVTGNAYAASVAVDGIIYEYDENTKTATVADQNRSVSGEITIPSSINVNGTSYTVTAINSLAFDKCNSLTGVELPNSLTTIGIGAFQQCEKLEYINVPNSLTSVPGYFLAECYSLSDVTIPNSVTSIGEWSFVNCISLTEITIPDSVTDIEGNAFLNCSGLTEIIIPDSVTNIGGNAFGGCSSLTSVTIPNSVTTIGWSAFGGCSSLTSVIISNGATSIGWRAFWSCRGLTDIYVKNDQELGNDIFRDTSENISVWRYVVNTPAAGTGDDKTHITIVSVKDKYEQDITTPVSLSSDAMGDGYVIDTVQCCSTGNATDGWTVFGQHNRSEEWSADGNKHWHECTACGEKNGEAVHTWDAGKVTKKATEEQAGTRTYTCTVCKATKTETIQKLKPSGTPLAKATVKKNSLTITWNKIKGAEGYDVFFSLCNHSKKEIKCKKVKTIKGNKTFKWTKSGLKKGTAYKFYVRAYVTKNGKKTYVKTSPIMHAYTGNGTKKYTNAKSVTVNKTKVTLKKGKTFKIKAKVNKVSKKKKLMPKSHAPTLRYMTSNKKIATVSASGKITAKGKGSCTVYAYAHNGVSKAIKVTVN